MAAPFDPTKVPSDIARAIMNGLRASAELVRSNAVANLNRVLRSKSGALTSSIYARTRQTRRGGSLQVGTKLAYGRFWENGFLRFGKYYRRPWLRPAVEATQAEVVRRIETQVASVVKDQFRTITIDIKF